MTAKHKGLTITKGSMTYEMEEVGAWSWSETENGTITFTASPPGVAAPAARKLGGNGLAAAVTPALGKLSEELKEKSRASAEAAKQAAQAAEQAKNPARTREPDDA